MCLHPRLIPNPKYRTSKREGEIARRKLRRRRSVDAVPEEEPEKADGAGEDEEEDDGFGDDFIDEGGDD